jgi:nonribosomal peptide synthetase DhbF
VAHAMATELGRRGHEVGLLALLDCVPSSGFEKQDDITRDDARASVEDYVAHFVNVGEHGAFLDTVAGVLANNMAIMKRFSSPVFRGDVVYFHAALEENDSWADLWRPHVAGTIEEHEVVSTHLDMNMPGPAAEVCAVINGLLSGSRADLAAST